jgi:hypothetical protein
MREDVRTLYCLSIENWRKELTRSIGDVRVISTPCILRLPVEVMVFSAIAVSGGMLMNRPVVPQR